MNTRVQVFAFVTAGLSATVSAWNWRKPRPIVAGRSSLASLCASLAILVIVAPNLAFPHVDWLGFVASFVSMGLSATTFVILLWSSRDGPQCAVKLPAWADRVRTGALA